MQRKAFFITGTDTGVGKTIIAGAVACWHRSQGRSVGVMKPAETGCRIKSGKLFPSDAAFLKRASGSKDSLEVICPYRFAEPLAPAIAARRAGKKIDVGVIKEIFGSIYSHNDISLVEGAGGIMVPLSAKYLFLDLAAELKLPLIIVGRAGLGTINHTVLTYNAAKARGLKISAIILNQSRKGPSGAAEETNARVIRKILGFERVYSTPFVPGAKRNGVLLQPLATLLNSSGFLS